jgi:hypothetical protein
VGVKNILSYVSSWRRSLDKESPAFVLSEKFGGSIATVFTIDVESMEQMQVFMNEHDRLHKGKDGAIGGRYTYEFTHTSLGLITVLRCACGAKCDPTKYEDW